MVIGFASQVTVKRSHCIMDNDYKKLLDHGFIGRSVKEPNLGVSRCLGKESNLEVSSPVVSDKVKTLGTYCHRPRC